MLLSIKTAVLLVVFIHYVEGFERVSIVVNESEVHKDISHNDEVLVTCCIHGKCSCPSLYNALANLTSNVLINITTDVTLFSIISLVDLANITITGHNNPTVNCNSSGRLEFISCHDCLIEGTNWKECGTKDVNDNENGSPVIQFCNSSNITFRNCTFEDCVGQVIVLSAMLGNVSICYCNFLSNNQYSHHGTTIFYISPNFSNNSLLISNCAFYCNEGATSIVYFGQSSPVYLEHAKFHNNKGVPIYLENQQLNIAGSAEFYHNIAENGGGIVISDHSSVVFHKNAKISFKNNTANNNGGAIFLTNHSSVMFKEHLTCYNLQINRAIMVFYNNIARNGGAMYAENSHVIFGESAEVELSRNKAKQVGGAVCIVQSTMIFEGNSTTVSLNDNNNVAVSIIEDSNITFAGTSNIKFNDNIAQNHGGAGMAVNNSTVTFKEDSTLTFNGNRAIDGGALTFKNNSFVMIDKNSNLIFNNNIAKYFGAVEISNSKVKVEGNSKLTFNGNKAYRNGGAISIHDKSSLIFAGTSTVKLTDNSAQGNGGAITVYTRSTVRFQSNSTVTFSNNSAQDFGGGIIISGNAGVTFEGNSAVMFNDNTVTKGNGGAFIIYSNCFVKFTENSNITFIGNNAYSGGAVFINKNAMITFQGNSTVLFTDNNANAQDGGAMMIDGSTIKFTEHSTANFSSNKARFIGGAIKISNSIATIEGNVKLTFSGNNANYQGGAVFIEHYSSVSFAVDSCVILFNNTCAEGGALAIHEYSNITFKENSTANLGHNSANGNGGAIAINSNCLATFQGNSKVMFYANKAGHDGGACIIENHSNITFSQMATVKFCYNIANTGGALLTRDTCIVTFEKNSVTTFHSNTADDEGGALMISQISVIIFEGNSTTRLNMNKAKHLGGALYIAYYSKVTINTNSTVKFSGNTADSNGGVMYINQHSTFKSKGNTKVTFNNGRANFGGSIFVESSNVTVEENSSIEFINNTALQNGGAIYLNDHSHLMFLNAANVTFHFNSASDYGGAIYALLEKSVITINSSNVSFSGNIARETQKSGYIKLPKSCNKDCLSHNVNDNFKKMTLSTSPNVLLLNNTLKCNNDSDEDRNTYHCYYKNSIMLGQEITIDACVLDYFDQPTDATDFLISGMAHQDYNISGLKYISVSCNQVIRGISIIGNLHSNHSYNYSINISLYTVHSSDTKIVSTMLIVELTQCHQGFWYSNKLHKCECYDAGNIISCSGSSSTIKRGYWFGNVTGKPTTTYCPDNYCNFTCCETTNNFYQLSPVRANQCRSHRSGTACGSCEEGYTLSFDTPDCIDMNKCTISQTALVTMLSMLYWIIVVIVVFVMTYFKFTIGSLYAIIFYYSIIDILISQASFTSNGLYTTINILSSLAKLTPQFLGQLCLVRNMSGIDQQFIHYVHPIMISLILVMISILARRSRRVSSFVSRGIIHFICFLLLLSYTSVATTSLLLMRPLAFVGIDKVYTYLSPDVEYFHGRHLAYIILAMIFTIVIVIGFPLLLLLEPFLNSKINFIKIKPLLDQFQGCYKDKYRYFAGYYMICRLVIILLVIVKISEEIITQYLLISFCALMQLVHVLARPYVSAINNIFDAIILQLIVIISVISVVEFTETYELNFILVITYLLVILPLLSFVVIKLCKNRKSMQSEIKLLRQKYIRNCKYKPLPTNDVEESIDEDQFGIIVDDTTRRNVTVVDV